MEAVWRVNNRGVCEMERFQFAKAVEAFAQVVEMAPDWRPGQLNLAIARMNNAKNASHDRAPEIRGNSVTCGWRKLLSCSKTAHTIHPVQK